MATLSSAVLSSSYSRPLRLSLVHPTSIFRSELPKESAVLPVLAVAGVCARPFILQNYECDRIITHAVAEALDAEPSVESEDKVATDEVTKMKLESDLLKKKAKREELRRKRLVRKRHMRKKGRWPPSKMAKLKNV